MPSLGTGGQAGDRAHVGGQTEAGEGEQGEESEWASVASFPINDAVGLPHSLTKKAEDLVIIIAGGCKQC